MQPTQDFLRRTRAIAITIAQAARTGVLQGSVSADSLGKHSLPGADVSIPALQLTTHANFAGEYRLAGIAPGRYLVIAMIGGRRSAGDSITIAAGENPDHDFVLATRVATLDSVVSTAASPARAYVSSALQGFEERSKQGFGTLVTEDQMRKADNEPLSEVLIQRLPGVILFPGPGGAMNIASGRKSSKGPALGTAGGGQGGACFAAVYVDGVLEYDYGMEKNVPHPEQLRPDFAKLSVNQYAGVEYYAGAATYPAWISRTNTDCGVLLLWTRERSGCWHRGTVRRRRQSRSKALPMYSTCIFCHSTLGRNEAVEHFPVGRRLAFDAGKGRLWVVCPSCARWNLTPLDARWEAIEDCERLFRGTRLRFSTDHIGLARVKEGTELVRVGRPQRPEMAAWRYGDRFQKRYNRTLLAAMGLSASAAVIAQGAGRLFTLGSSAVAIQLIVGLGWPVVKSRRLAAGVRGPDGNLLLVRGAHLGALRLDASDESSVALSIQHAKPGALYSQRWGPVSSSDPRTTLSGAAALHALSRLMPRVNVAGGEGKHVKLAVEVLDDAPDPMAVLGLVRRDQRDLAANQRKGGLFDFPLGGRRNVAAGGLFVQPPLRLALEMVLHEDDERRALEGELAALESEWREAEEIAAIADDMFLPAGVRAALDALKGR